MNAMEEPPPPLPIQLKMCITEESKVNVVVERVVNSHYYNCPLRHEVATQCGDGLCRYFTWHLNHHTSHRPGAADCAHCALFERWIEKHSSLYCRSSCGLSLCNEMKKQRVKSRMQPCADVFDLYLKSPSSSLTRTTSLLPCLTSSLSSCGEPTEQASTRVAGYTQEEEEEDEGRGYSSASTSCNSSPHSTQTFDRLDEDVEPAAPTSDVRFITHGQLTREPSVSYMGKNDPLSFAQNQSQDSLRSYRARKQRVNSRDSVQEETACFLMGSISLEDSLPLAPPQPSSSSTTNEEERTVGGEFCANRSAPQSASSTRQSLVSSCGKKRENFNSDSAISSTSENEEMSSMESVADCTATSTTSTLDASSPSTACPTNSELASTPSTVLGPSFDNSGSSVRTASSPAEPMDDGSLSQLNIAELCQLTDRLQDQYQCEITMLKNKGRPLYTSDPRPPTEVESDDSVHVDDNWRESYGRLALGHQKGSLEQSQLDQQFMSRETEFPTDDETIERALDHREFVKEYLQGQFYLQQTYSEHIHWRRVRQVGHGGQAKCFCIEDCVNNYALCLKEETESNKTLDEAFICLTLARLVNDAPPNIVEFFGASILPHYSGSNRLQLFLELMPGCLQEYVFENGPLSPQKTLNYSYQLFEALDYLHQELHLIHCDIKPANLLIDYNCQRLKVADFGCAELLNETCHRKGFPENKDAGTLWYNPPDFYCSGDCSFGMDIWQAGCSVLFMATGRRPWRHLCMDVDKQKAGPGIASLMKKRYCQMIGEQNERPYPLPAFLAARAELGRAEGGAGVGQLLYGCLQTSSARLSARDLAYLAAVSETTSPEQRTRIVKQLGYSPSRDVLERLQRVSHTHQPMVDVYLGKDMFKTNIDSMSHAMLNGWLGSVPHRNGMTYGELFHLVRQLLPVTRHFGECAMSVNQSDPHVIWRAVSSGTRPNLVRPTHLVDPSRALLLHPLCIQRTCV